MTEKLYIYDTEKRMKREFVHIVKGRVGMYVCGPTVYGDPHLGHDITPAGCQNLSGCHDGMYLGR